MIKQLSPRDWEILSAYLDRQLKPKEVAALEIRLSADPDLSGALGELQRTRDALRSLPRLRAPRNFTLTPQMVGQSVAWRPRAASRLAPVFGFASALAAFLLILVVVGDLLGFLAPSTGTVALAPQRASITTQAPLLGQAPRQTIAATVEAPAASSMLGGASQPTSTPETNESVQGFTQQSDQAITATVPITPALGATLYNQAEETPAFTDTLTAPISATTKLGVGLGGGTSEPGSDLVSSSDGVVTLENPVWTTILVVTVSSTETLTFPMTITLDAATQHMLPLEPTLELQLEPTQVPTLEPPAAATEPPTPVITSPPAAIARVDETPTASRPQPQTFQPALPSTETPPVLAVVPAAASQPTRPGRTSVRILEIALAFVTLAAGLASGILWWFKRM